MLTALRRLASVPRTSTLIQSSALPLSSSVASSSPSPSSTPVSIPVRKLPDPSVPEWLSQLNLSYPVRPFVNADNVPALGGTESLPFRITRTNNNNFPLYTDFRNGRTRVLTRIRRLTGDVGAFKQELVKVLPPDTEIYMGTGYIDVKGNHVQRLRQWLAALGF
eukprot:GILI01006973.1.p1 GENE.GILI01006973.1~~GILI01006973.1.p1  ORF type:complete len:164 (+),score=17.67 GILI01006973.1:55-546(+)